MHLKEYGKINERIEKIEKKIVKHMKAESKLIRSQIPSSQVSDRGSVGN